MACFNKNFNYGQGFMNVYSQQQDLSLFTFVLTNSQMNGGTVRWI